MKYRYSIVSLLLVISLYSQGIYGSKSLFTTPTSQTIPVGQLNLFSGMSAFADLNTSVQFGNITSTSDQINIWQINVDATFSYGVMEDVDITTNIRMYQDVQGDDNNIPGNINIIAKYGNIEVVNRELMMSILLYAHSGLAAKQNLPYEEYFGLGVGAGLGLNFSYYSDQYLPNENFSAHFLSGIRLNLDSGKDVSRVGDNTVLGNTSNTMRLFYSLGVQYPYKKLNIIGELNGTMFLTRPHEYVYGRHDRIGLNLGVRYQASTWVSLDLFADLKVSESTETISNERNFSFIGQLAPWKINLGVSFALRKNDSYGKTQSEIQRNEYRRKLQTFKGLLEEQDNADKIQGELERLREEREKAEKELEELKKILED